MAENTSGGARWFKYGCLGCVGLVVLVALMIAAVFGIAWVGREEPDVRDQALTHELARPEAVVGATSEALPARPGMVRLEIASAECEVAAAAAGEPLHVDARYDANLYVMEESLDDSGEGPWTYSMTFRDKSSGVLSTLRKIFAGRSPKIGIRLPPDVPFSLDVEASRGGCNIDLGGLWLTDAALRGNMAGLNVSVGEPTREPLESFDIDITMAGANLHDLGNASPRRLSIDVAMAGMNLDLRGAWRNDSEITLGLRKGGGTLRLPRDVTIEGLDAKGIQANADPEIPRPVLRFTPDSVLDDIDVRR